MSWHDVGWYRLCVDWVIDPQRRKQVLVTYFLERWLPTALCLMYWHGWWAFAIALPIPFAQFLVYEFVLEWALAKWKLCGPYWERQPSEGTTFTRW
jgi:hypothetical protein